METTKEAPIVAVPPVPVRQAVNATATQTTNETPAVSPATPEQIKELEITVALETIRAAIIRKDDDPEQVSVVDALQQHKALLLDYATMSFFRQPNNPKLLEAITGLITTIEKSVRDDRKEKAKAKEKEDDKVSFNQMLEAMKQISSGKIQLPTFNVHNFLLDPSKSLMSTIPDANPIDEAELEEGNGIVDIDGKKLN